MQLGVIIGTVEAGKKVGSLAGLVFLLVAPEGHQGPALVCVDQVGAGLGDRVLVCLGSAARTDGTTPMPVDAAIVALVDRTDPA